MPKLYSSDEIVKVFERNGFIFITASEERREKRAKRSFSWRPSEDGTKGLIPRPSGAGESERSEHKMGSGLCPAVNTLYNNGI